MQKILTAFLLLIAVLRADAAVHVWTGATSSVFSDGSNWRGGSPAGDPDAELAFPPSATRLAITNDIASLTVKSISITGPGYTIGGLPLSLAADADVTDFSSGPSTIACDLHLAGSATFRNNSDELDGGLILTGAISGTGPITKLGDGRVTFAGTNANTYSGETRVLRGELRLAKSDNTRAVGGNLVIDGAVSTIASEQIPDSATIRIAGSLDIGRIETLGPLVIDSGAQITARTAILGGDVTILPGFNNDTAFDGEFALAGTRTFTSCDACSWTMLSNVRDHTPGAGLILRGGRFEIIGSYRGPTVIERADAIVNNAETSVRLRGGTFSGTVASLFAEEGFIEEAETFGDLILSSRTTVLVQFRPVRGYELSAGGALELNGAKLFLEAWPDPPLLGREHVIGEKRSAGAIRGTFSGFPEGSIAQGKFRVSYAGGNGNDLTLTEVGRYFTSTHVNADPDSVAEGETVTLRAHVFSERGTPTGTITFREGTTVLGTVPFEASGFASLVLQPTWGQHTYIATYDGSAEQAPSSDTVHLDVRPAAATITSVEPSTFTGGTTVDVTVRGTNFLPEGEVYVSSVSQPYTYVSSTELRFTWHVPRDEEEVTRELWYTQPGPGGVQSNHVPIVVKPASPDEPKLAFEQRAITAPVVPGGGAAWMSVAYRRVNFTTTFERRTAITPDSDNDGRVRWEQTDDIPRFGVWLAVDMADGRIFASRPNGVPEDPAPFPPAMFLRDEQGRYAHIVFQHHFEPWDLLWVRPGVGAWTMTLDADANDLDGMANGYGVYNVSQMRAVGNSPAPPNGIERGDVIAGIDWNVNRWFGDRVDDHLAESDGPGMLLLSHPHNQNEGVVEAVPFVVLRLGGTDGTVSVNYTTVNDTAIAGVHYEARAGTLTFGPGEIVKRIEVPLIDDAVYSGYTRFRVALSHPVNTIITGESSGSVELNDDEPPPEISAEDITVIEGDHGTHEVQFVVRVSGATRVPVTARWSAQQASGELSFLPGGPASYTITVPYEANEIPEHDREIDIWISDIEGAEPSNLFGTITIVDDDVAEIVVLDAAVSESREEANVTIALAHPIKREVSVRYATQSGTATAGNDFSSASGTVTFNEHTMEQTVRVPILRDSNVEGEEWFSVVLSDPQNAVLRRPSATVFLIDDDTTALPAISGSPVVTVEGETSAVRFRFRLSFPVKHEVRFRAATLTGSAIDDFVATSSIVVIPAGETEGNLLVTVVNDPHHESTETFSVVLSEPVGATIATPSVTATILDDDAPPFVFIPLSVTGEDAIEGTPAKFTIRLAQPLQFPVSVAFATADATAVAPEDYVHQSRSVTFEAGEIVKTVQIATVDDAQYEPDEAFTLVIGHATPPATARILDNDPAPTPKTRAVRH